MITFKEFIKKYIGKAIDFDGTSGVQCVDLAKLYLKKCFDIDCGKMGNAKDWWTDRNENKILKKNFKFITIDSTRPYAKTKIQAGDIGIRTSGTYGHIFVIESVKNNIITYYDFNGTGKHDKMTKRKKPFTNYYVTGILRKKTDSVKVTAMTGLHYYQTLSDDKPSGTIPHGKKINLIVSGAGKKKIDGKSYNMGIAWYKGNQVYIAEKYTN